MCTLSETQQNPTNMALPIKHFKSDAIEIFPGDLSKGIILMCEHASSTIPEHYNNLGLPERQLQRHIAYDIGAKAVTAFISKQLNVPAITTCYSRLLIDPNRALHDPTLIMQLSDGAVIPGNAYISPKETAHRIQHYYQPYHIALKKLIDAALAEGTTPMLMSVHSFTDRWKTVLRPWEIGILWDKDPRLPAYFLEQLALMMPSEKIGDNEPYSGRLIQDSMYSHATMRGLAHCLIELRQDLITKPEGQEKWGKILANLLQKSLDTPKQQELLHSKQDFGSYISPIS